MRCTPGCGIPPSWLGQPGECWPKLGRVSARARAAQSVCPLSNDEIQLPTGNEMFT